MRRRVSYSISSLVVWFPSVCTHFHKDGGEAQSEPFVQKFQYSADSVAVLGRVESRVSAWANPVIFLGEVVCRVRTLSRLLFLRDPLLSFCVYITSLLICAISSGGTRMLTASFFSLRTISLHLFELFVLSSNGLAHASRPHVRHLRGSHLC